MTAPTVRRIGFAVNEHNPEAADVLARGLAWCSRHGVEAWESDADDGDAIAGRLAGTDLLCALGGDGTFLRVARAIGDSGVPTLGVNLGRVGFLAKVERTDLEQALDEIVSGRFRTEERMRLSATVARVDGRLEVHPCLNDVAVARGGRVRLIEVEVEVGGSHLATYLADGVVVATPTGSTAYSFSAGGAIIDPRLRNLVVTPVAAYLSALHSVVVGEEHLIRLALREARDGALASFDGQWDLPIQVGETIEVRALETPLRLVEPESSAAFYDLLRTKAARLPA